VDTISYSLEFQLFSRELLKFRDLNLCFVLLAKENQHLQFNESILKVNYFRQKMVMYNKYDNVHWTFS
jgi:hypothetical protein